MTRVPSPNWQQPTKFGDIVNVEYQRHARRVAELRAAEKQIRAMEPDLRELVGKGIFYSASERSFQRIDARTDRSIGRAVYALTLDHGVFSACGDQLAKGFIDLGYEVERCEDCRYMPRVFLHRPKTQIRVTIRCTPEFRDSIIREVA